MAVTIDNPVKSRLAGANVKAVATYYGLSTDTKPAKANNGSAFVEMNTGKLYFFNAAGGAWVEWGA